MKTNRSCILTLGAVLAALSALPAAAKLPEPSAEAKAKAAEAAARTAWANKVSDYKLCQSMDRVAARYRADRKSAGAEAKPATPTPACADPGPFVPPAQ